jgi:hypothetical protein
MAHAGRARSPSGVEFCNCGFLGQVRTALSVLTVRLPPTVNIALAVTALLTVRQLPTVKKFLSLTQFIWNLSLGIAVPSAGAFN